MQALRLDANRSIESFTLDRGALQSRSARYLLSEHALVEQTPRLIAAGDYSARYMAGLPYPFHFCATPLLLSGDENTLLAEACAIIHTAVERVADGWVEGHGFCRDHFRGVSRALEYAQRQLPWWQLSSRYDFLIDSDNRIRFVELNGGVPITHAMATASVQSARALWNDKLPFEPQVAEDPTWFARELLELEARAGYGEGLIVIASDSRGLSLEQNLLCDMLGRLGREALRCNAAELDAYDGQLILRGRPVSMVYNRSFFCNGESDWSDEYRRSCAPLLAAWRRGSFLAVNGAVGMALGEDKGVLACLSSPSVVEELGLDSRVLDLVPWTRRLKQSVTDYQGERVVLSDFARKHREALVLKPAFRLQGEGVVLGALCSPREWDAHLREAQPENHILQERVNAPRFEATWVLRDQINTRYGFHVGSCFVIGGRTKSVLSRLSPSHVVNAAGGAAVQPVFITS